MDGLSTTSLAGVTLLIIGVLIVGGIIALYGIKGYKKQKRLDQHYVALKEVRHNARARQAHHSERGAHHKALVHFLIHWGLLPFCILLAMLGAGEGTTRPYDEPLPHQPATVMTRDYAEPPPSTTALPDPNASIVEDDADVALMKMMKAGNDFASGVSDPLKREPETPLVAAPPTSMGPPDPPPPDPPDAQRDAVAKRGFLRRLLRK